MRFDAKFCSLIGLTLGGLGATAVLASDATSPVDYTQRNAPFTPAGTITPETKRPEVDARVQDKRVEKTLVDRKVSGLGEQRAPVSVQEAREKVVREKESRRPEAREQPLSSLNHREARVSTAADGKKPVLVTKYQDSLQAASAANLARFPALDQATGAKINRFVFRRNGADSSAVTNGAEVTPAAGGSPIRK